ncbi:hypothetical protein Y032_0534g3070 [Ancylostoma ceylanicum]|uniref:G-protein coupled receptors family 1 profile domain-containing protein n=1 Tax=Ancylostoma ceylanicum TaxID=53326 RepID=A0A016WRB8_9BILA|nr:hypothetical protein Y032_0534g3070 [Ancylostoma ceylanicum]
MNGLRIALLVINSLISSAGIVANLVLLIIISVATPKPIRTYSVLIVNYAVTDLFTSLAQALTVPRLITENGSFLLVFYGACSEISSRTCLYSFFVETFGFSHGLNSILLSICYRYFSLRYGVPKRKPIIILCFITCLPSLVPMLVLCQKWANESTVANLIAKYRSDMPQTSALECVCWRVEPLKTRRGCDGDLAFTAGILDASDVLVSCVLIFYVLPWLPIMITINVLKSKMYALVRCRATVLSSETLRLHANLIKALTTQSLTPFLHLITYLCYIIEQHIYSNPVTELIIFIPVGVLSIVTPIINIYYIRPYREMFKRCLRYQSKPSEVSRSKVSFSRK